MKNTNVLFVLIIVAMTFIAAVTFIENHLMFADQPGLEDAFSWLWTAVLVVILYRMLRYTFGSSTTAPVERRHSMYGALIYLVEVLAVASMVAIAILFASTFTASSGPETPVLLLLGFVGFLALALPLGIHFMRQGKQRRNADTTESYDLR